MKSLLPVLLLYLALGWQPPFSRAQDSTPAPLDAAVTQLDTDLLALPAGSPVTDAQHQAIVADLNALAVGIVPAPAATDIDAVATNLGNAAVAGNVTADTLAELNTDLAADATDADDWLDDISGDASDLLAPADSATDPGDPGVGWGSPLIETLVPNSVTATATRPRRTSRHHNFDLTVESGQSPANQFYYALAALDTRQVDGSAPVGTVSVQVVGLPTSSNPYTVTATRKSDGASVTLGRFNVKPVSSDVFNEYLTADTPDDYDEGVENLTLGKAIFGGSHPKKALPASFDARDVAMITLTDASGVARLSGRPGLGVGNYRVRSAVLHLYGDPAAAPTASGLAKGSASGNEGDNFYFSARHLPASTAVTLVADGVVVGQFTTGAHGRLVVAEGTYPKPFTHTGARLYPQRLSLPVDLSRVKSLTVVDPQGVVLLGSPTS